MAELVPQAIAFHREIENRLASAFEGFEAGPEKLLGELE